MNYHYDELGNLTKDISEEIDEIQWYVNGKIKAIIRETSSDKPNLYFDYSSDGQRVYKKVVADAVTGGVTETWYLRDAQGNVMATYDFSSESQDTTQVGREYYLYGSSRLGNKARNVEVVSITLPADSFRQGRVLGYKQYELTNHLGNVMAVITDQKEPVDGNTDQVVDFWNARIVTMNDYYPFGSLVPSRYGSQSSYRYGFNGKESDDEVSGTGNQYDYGFRVYNPRIAKYLQRQNLETCPWIELER